MASYFFGGFVAVGTPDKLITVLHSEQRKTSWCSRSGRDFLPTIATPQTGQRCGFGGSLSGLGLNDMAVRIRLTR